MESVTQSWASLGDIFFMAGTFCMLAAWIFFDRMAARLNRYRPSDRQIRRRIVDPQPRGPRPRPFLWLFDYEREYQQIYGDNYLPRLCLWWFIGAMVLYTAAAVLGLFGP